MLEPTIAVCIPTIPGREELLERAVASVEAQTRKPDELVIIKDDEAKGAGATRNIAWRTAKTDLIAMLDDDDEFLPDHIAKCIEPFIRDSRIDLVYPWFEHVGWPDYTEERPDPLATVQNGELVHPLGVPFGPEQAEHLRKYAWIPSTVVVRRTKLEEVGGYPEFGTEEYEKSNRCEDWGLLLKLLDSGAQFFHVPERTWRLHSGSGTAGQPWTQDEPEPTPRHLDEAFSYPKPDSITVVIPSIPPRAELLRERALRSVFAQNLAPDSVIVELDRHHTGAGRTRNRALAKVHSEWVAFLDDDDELYPHHLETLLNHAKTTGADVVWPWYDPAGLFTGDPLPHRGRQWDPEDPHTFPITALVRTSFAQRTKFPDPVSDAFSGEDWFFWIDLSKMGAKFSHTPEITWAWYFHGNNTSGSPARWEG